MVQWTGHHSKGTSIPLLVYNRKGMEDPVIYVQARRLTQRERFMKLERVVAGMLTKLFSYLDFNTHLY